MIGRPYALLWSQSENAAKVMPLDECCSENRAAYADNQPGDYRLLLVGTQADAEATAASILPTLAHRGSDAVCTRCGQSGHRASGCKWPTVTDPARARFADAVDAAEVS